MLFSVIKKGRQTIVLMSLYLKLAQCKSELQWTTTNFTVRHLTKYVKDCNI